MIRKIIFIIFLSMTFFIKSIADNTVSIGSKESKVNIKVFSSLTCPHCANFHNVIFKKLKKNYIDTNQVSFEHHGFPLDLAALNGELILRCESDPNKRIDLLGAIYKKQTEWAKGSDINKINISIKKIGKEFGLNESKMENCLKDENVQDQILNERINAQKKYKISSTPTIIINEKKYEGKHNFDKLEKEIKKLL